MQRTEITRGSTTKRYQIYLPWGLAERLEAFAAQQRFSLAAAGRILIQRALNHGEGSTAATDVEPFEHRIAMTLSEHREFHREQLEEIQQLLKQLLIRH